MGGSGDEVSETMSFVGRALLLMRDVSKILCAESGRGTREEIFGAHTSIVLPSVDADAV
jgi:hypothetical protein